MAVNESDALSAVHRLRWKLPIAWSGRQSACHCKNSHSVTRDQASFTAWCGRYTSPSTTGRCRIPP